MIYPGVRLTTSKGEVDIELYENEAPETVGNFINLVEQGYYDGLKFHRVLQNFMAQTGCPKGDGTGGPGYRIYCECLTRNDYRNFFAGSLGMAHGGPNTGGSQFFITFRPTANLNGKHTCFGRVIRGLDIVKEITKINPEKPDPGCRSLTGLSRLKYYGSVITPMSRDALPTNAYPLLTLRQLLIFLQQIHTCIRSSTG